MSKKPENVGIWISGVSDDVAATVLSTICTVIQSDNSDSVKTSALEVISKLHFAPRNSHLIDNTVVMDGVRKKAATAKKEA